MALDSHGAMKGLAEGRILRGALLRRCFGTGCSADDRPGSIRLFASSAACFLGSPLDIVHLAEIAAAKAAQIVVLARDAKLAVVIVLTVVPAIGRLGAPVVEAVIIGPVGVTPIFAIEIARQGGPSARR